MPAIPHASQAFRAAAIEVVTRYLTPQTLSSLFPLVLLWAGLLGLDHLLFQHLPALLHPLPLLAASSYLIARFAAGAKEGRKHADLWEGVHWPVVNQIALRHFLLSIAWMLPLALLVLWSAPAKAAQGLEGQLVWLRLFGASLDLPRFPIWALLTALCGTLLLPAVTIVAASLANHWEDLLRPSFWKQIWSQRSHETWAVLTLGLGGALVAMLLYLPVLAGLALILLKVSLTLSKMIGMAAILFPLLGWQILMGRLAGTLAYHFPPKRSEEEWGGSEEAIVAVIHNEEHAAYQESDPLPQASRIQFLAKAAPADSTLRDEAIRTIGQLATSEGNGPQAIALFSAFGKHRHELPLTAPVLEALLRHFQSAGTWKEAGWCAYMASFRTGDTARAEKRLVELADQASQKSHREEAVALYSFYLRRHPQGGFAEYVRKALELQRKLTGAQPAIR